MTIHIASRLIAADELVTCSARRVRSNARCELPVGHPTGPDEAFRDEHIGRDSRGRWFVWTDDLTRGEAVMGA